MLDTLVTKPLIGRELLAAPLWRDVKQAKLRRNRLLEPIRSSPQRVATGPLVVVTVRRTAAVLRVVVGPKLDLLC